MLLQVGMFSWICTIPGLVELGGGGGGGGGEIIENFVLFIYIYIYICQETAGWET